MSSRNDDQRTPPEKENNTGSSLDHMDDIELGRVSPPTELDFSRLNETKIAKIGMEKNKPIRPDWLWEKREDGSYEYWVRENVEIRAYIEYLERSAKDARRKMDEVIFTFRGKTGAALNRAEYAVEQITKIMGVLDVDSVVRHELSCIWPDDDRVKCNGYRDGNCAMPTRREEICKDIPKDGIPLIDEYVDEKITIDKMLILPGSIVISDNPLSIAAYFEEYGDWDAEELPKDEQMIEIVCEKCTYTGIDEDDGSRECHGHRHEYNPDNISIEDEKIHWEKAFAGESMTCPRFGIKIEDLTFVPYVPPEEPDFIDEHVEKYIEEPDKEGW